MEESKYYTPEIEEFHIGFEFEKYDERPATYKENNYVPTNWHKFKYDLKSIRLSQLGTHLHDKTIRTKFLDKEDIESLGWRLNPRGTYYSIEISGDGSDTQLYYTKETYLTIYDWDSQYLFRGYIKNKSELVKLMKQLRINEG